MLLCNTHLVSSSHCACWLFDWVAFLMSSSSSNFDPGLSRKQGWLDLPHFANNLTNSHFPSRSIQRRKVLFIQITLYTCQLNPLGPMSGIVGKWTLYWTKLLPKGMGLLKTIEPPHRQTVVAMTFTCFFHCYFCNN